MIGEVHAWAIDLGRLAGEEASLALVLSETERVRAGGFVDAAVSRRFVLAHGSLRRLLGGYLGHGAEQIEFAVTAEGKPILAGEAANTGITFNLSHSGDVALVAVASGRAVGIDVERLRSVEDALVMARRYFTAGEYRTLSSLPETARARAFLACWTRKESIMKAHGKGMALLGEIDTTMAPFTVAGQTYAVLDLADLGEYVGAVAVEGSEPRVCRMSISDLP
jgi:4'-phosphopantetheinyl transferase